ncbi:MAG: exported protein of unknown function, partial [Solirubrobacterales bacterium]|nr:exported protein of unknown function [Solirubrobacterales bacterium]
RLARAASTGVATLTLDGVPVAHDVDTVIRTIALPAGTYRVPVRWRAADGTLTDVGVVRIVSFALTREGAQDVDAGAPANPFATPLRAPLAGLETDASAVDAADEESETFDVVDPIDSDRIVTAANDTSHIERGVYLSDDGGKSFSAPRFPAMADIPGVAGPEATDVGGDPILAADRLGNVWAGGLTVCTAAGAHSRIFVARIPAGSRTFVPLLVGLPYLHTESGCAQGTEGLQDKPMMTIDDAPTSPTYGRLYVSWDDPDPSGAVNEVLAFCDTRVGGFTQVERCDNADTWVGPVVTSAAPGSYVTSDPATGPDGKVYMAWWDYSAANQISITSCDAAVADCSRHAAWTAPRAAVALETDPATGDPVPFGCPINAQPGGRAAPVPSLAVDHSGGPGNGRIYLAWSDLRPRSGTTRCMYQDVSGTPPLPTHETWDSYVASAPSLAALLSGADRTSPAVGRSIIGDTSTSSLSATNSDDWFPWIAVDQTTGQAWVDVYSTTGDARRGLTDTYIARVAPAAGTQVTYADLQKVSAAPSDYSVTGTSGCCTFGNDYGDYTGNSAAEGVTVPVYTSRANAGARGRVRVYVPSAASPEAVLQQASFADAYGAAGDGKVQPGEAFTLTAVLKNTGPAAATNLSGVLSSTFPQVSLTSASSAYPDLAAATGTGANVTSFTGTLAPTTPCGVTIDLLLSVATTQGPERVPVPVPVSCGANQIPAGGGGSSPGTTPANEPTTPTIPTTPTTPAVITTTPEAGTTPATTTTTPSAQTRPLPTLFRLSAAIDRQLVRTVRTRGLRLRLRGTQAVTATVTVTVSRAVAQRLGLPSLTLLRARVKLAAGTRRVVRLRPSAAVVSRLKGRQNLPVVLRVSATPASGRTVVVTRAQRLG